MKKDYVKDEDGNKVRDGDRITFSYGIPPVVVRATVQEIDGVLWAMTPGHKPDRCRLNRLRSIIGCFYKDRPTQGEKRE